MNNLWFKRKTYGWGWTPATKEGWFTIFIYIILVLLFASTIDTNSSTKEIFFTGILPITLLTVTLIRICYKKGETPKWSWGPEKDNHMTIEEIKNLYPNIDINLSGGSDSYQEGKPIVERDPIAVIIKHPTEEQYLIAKWKNSDWNGFLTGGIEDGDTMEQTVVKEIHEETGYKNVAEVRLMDFVSHGLFFHPIKNVNRLAHYHLVFAQLADLEQDEVSEEEQAIADFVWMKEDEVHATLTRNDMKLLWEYYRKNILG